MKEPPVSFHKGFPFATVFAFFPLKQSASPPLSLDLDVPRASLRISFHPFTLIADFD